MTWARAGGGKKRKRYTPSDRATRMKEVRAAWLATGATPFPRGTALAMRCQFFFCRPDGHFGTGRNQGVLKEKYVDTMPTGKNTGDLDNLVKLVKDALNGVAFHDDSQIVEYHQPFGKLYLDEFDAMPYTVIELAVAAGPGAPGRLPPGRE